MPQGNDLDRKDFADHHGKAQGPNSKALETLVCKDGDMAEQAVLYE